MSTTGTSKAVRIAAGILGALMLVVMLFSALYIVEEAEHHCVGDDCPICACIQQCGTMLRGFSGKLTAQLSAVMPVILVLLFVVIPVTAPSRHTLVFGKVRLNN